jgi:hypothetical protein
MRENKTLPRLIQDAIDKGATTVEEIHKSIADLPLKILQDTDLLRGPAKEVKRVQDHTIGAIYKLIRDVNEQVGEFASDLLAKASKPGAGRRGARVKRRSAAGAAKR